VARSRRLDLVKELEYIEDHCPIAVLRGQRIIRLSEQRLEPFQLDYQTIYELGTNNMGVLIGGDDSIERHFERIADLAKVNIPGTIVVVVSTKKLADWIYKELTGFSRKSGRPDVWETGCVRLTTPERLGKIDPTPIHGRPVLAVILFDPRCIVYKARGESGYGWHPNDRPQFITKFRYVHSRQDWQPPFILMTIKPAKSLNANLMLAPFGIEAWWFVDGKTLKVNHVTVTGTQSDSTFGEDK